MALTVALESWFNDGEIVPAIHAERVQLFLARSGEDAWERAFLAVFAYHFSACNVGGYDGMTRRAREIGAYPVPRSAGRAVKADSRPRLANERRG